MLSHYFRFCTTRIFPLSETTFHRLVEISCNFWLGKSSHPFHLWDVCTEGGLTSILISFPDAFVSVQQQQGRRGRSGARRCQPGRVPAPQELGDQDQDDGVQDVAAVQAAVQ